MERESTILEMVDHYLSHSGFTLTQFAERSGLRTGTLSNLIHGRRPLSIRQLDLITAGLNREEGTLYEQYIDEHILSHPPNWRRARPLLFRCAELGKPASVKRLVSWLAEQLSYLPMLFETAEELAASGHSEAAAILYECVAEAERYQHSERLALCQYRLFLLSLGKEQERNGKAAHRFEPFLDRLDAPYQLDALKKLADVQASLHAWSQVDQLADKLAQKAERFAGQALEPPPERPLLYYLHYAYLLKAAVCDAGREYGQALQWTTRYASLTSGTPIESFTGDEQIVILQFREWATANSLVYRLMSGDNTVMESYLDYVEARPNEIPTALYMIVQAANLHSFRIDDALARFRNQMEFEEQQSRMGKVDRHIAADRHAGYHVELGEYYLRTGRPAVGLEHILTGLKLAGGIGNVQILLKAVSDFEQNRGFASLEQEEDYKKWRTSVLA